MWNRETLKAMASFRAQRNIRRNGDGWRRWRDERVPADCLAKLRHARAFDLLERPIQTRAGAEADTRRDYLDRFARGNEQTLGGSDTRARQILMWRYSERAAEHADKMVPRHLRRIREHFAVDIRKILSVDESACRFQPVRYAA